MLTLASVRPAPEVRNLLLFADDADTGLHYLLPVALVPEDAGTLTVMGRGSRRRPEGILGGFWTLSLHGNVADATRTALAAALATPEIPQPRLLMAEAQLDLHLTLATDAAARARVEGWRGGTVALNGELPPGEAAGAVVTAWQNGLPDASAELILTVRGLGEPAELVVEDNRLRTVTAPGYRKVESLSHSLAARRQDAAALTIRHRQPLRLPGRGRDGGIVWAGFDPQ